MGAKARFRALLAVRLNSMKLALTDIPHVVGVGFLSAPDNNELPVSESPKGITYYFPKPTSQFWHPAYSGLFGIDPRLPEIVV